MLVVVNTIDVEVRNVADTATIVAIKQTVRNTFSHLVGVWRVQVSSSDERDRWDLRIRGGFGHHVASFLSAPDLLAERVERHLCMFLQGVVPPLSGKPRRPVLVIRGVQTDQLPRQLRSPQWRLSRNLHQKAS
jgi:hypothetical protein